MSRIRAQLETKVGQLADDLEAAKAGQAKAESGLAEAKTAQAKAEAGQAEAEAGQAKAEAALAKAKTALAKATSKTKAQSAEPAKNGGTATTGKAAKGADTASAQTTKTP